jgi:phosphopantothenoylcysteine synthetase/decarboxylase
MSPDGRLLYVIVCAAPPAAQVQELVRLAAARGWRVAVTASPDALAFIDCRLLEQLTGFPVHSRWRSPAEASSVPDADALAAAPATFNTINKLAMGITDTVAAATLCEYLAQSAPIVLVPNVKPELAAHPVFEANLRRLQEWGVHVLYDRAAPRKERTVPWTQILDEVERALAGSEQDRAVGQ